MSNPTPSNASPILLAAESPAARHYPWSIMALYYVGAKMSGLTCGHVLEGTQPGVALSSSTTCSIREIEG